MPISEIIKQRIKKANAPFFSTDNISRFIHSDEERQQLQQEVEEKYQSLLDSLLIDTTNDHNTKETAHRVAKMFINELFKGRYYEEPKCTEFPNVKKYDDMYIIGPIHFNSCCAHHMLPIIGDVWIGLVEPRDLLGLSKFHRLTRWVMERPSIQEESNVILADLIESKVHPEGLGVFIKAMHSCVSIRGVQDKDSIMTSSVMRGSFRSEPNIKQEFLSLIKV